MGWLSRSRQRAAQRDAARYQALLAGELARRAPDIERLNEAMSANSGLRFSVVGAGVVAECLTCGTTWAVPFEGGSAVCPNGCNADR